MLQVPDHVYYNYLIPEEETRAWTNVGLLCRSLNLSSFGSWQKCMGQLSGNDNRPGQLGNTGQIVLNTCDSGGCDCDEEIRKKTSTTTTTTTTAAPPPRPPRKKLINRIRGRYSPQSLLTRRREPSSYSSAIPTRTEANEDDGREIVVLEDGGVEPLDPPRLIEEGQEEVVPPKDLTSLYLLNNRGLPRQRVLRQRY